MNLATEVQEGTSVWMSSRDKEKTTSGLDRMAAQIKQELGGAQPRLVLHFDCTARGKVMFRDKEKLQLLRQLRQAVGPEAPWAGFTLSGRSACGQAQLLPQLQQLSLPELMMDGTVLA